jgi:hypothetical protein
VSGRQPDLALDWWVTLQAGSGHRRRQPDTGLVLRDVARLQLDQVDLVEGAQAVGQRGIQRSAFAQVGSQVVGEQATGEVSRLQLGAEDPESLQVCLGGRLVWVCSSGSTTARRIEWSVVQKA